MHAQFTPRGHSIVMVYNYDIYYKTGPKAAQTYRITKTGAPGVIYNGVPDWLYEGNFKWLNYNFEVETTAIKLKLRLVKTTMLNLN